MGIDYKKKYLKYKNKYLEAKKIYGGSIDAILESRVGSEGKAGERDGWAEGLWEILPSSWVESSTTTTPSPSPEGTSPASLSPEGEGKVNPTAEKIISRDNQNISPTPPSHPTPTSTPEPVTARVNPASLSSEGEGKVKPTAEKELSLDELMKEIDQMLVRLEEISKLKIESGGLKTLLTSLKKKFLKCENALKKGESLVKLITSKQKGPLKKFLKKNNYILNKINVEQLQNIMKILNNGSIPDGIEGKGRQTLKSSINNLIQETKKEEDEDDDKKEIEISPFSDEFGRGKEERERERGVREDSAN